MQLRFERATIILCISGYEEHVQQGPGRWGAINQIITLNHYSSQSELPCYLDRILCKDDVSCLVSLLCMWQCINALHIVLYYTSNTSVDKQVKTSDSQHIAPIERVKNKECSTYHISIDLWFMQWRIHRLQHWMSEMEINSVLHSSLSHALVERCTVHQTQEQRQRKKLNM